MEILVAVRLTHNDFVEVRARLVEEGRSVTAVREFVTRSLLEPNHLDSQRLLRMLPVTGEVNFLYGHLRSSVQQLPPDSSAGGVRAQGGADRGSQAPSGAGDDGFRRGGTERGEGDKAALVRRHPREQAAQRETEGRGRADQRPVKRPETPRGGQRPCSVLPQRGSTKKPSDGASFGDVKRKASEELTVRAKANEGDAVGRDSVDQQQVGPEVALPTVYPVPPQGMVLQEFGQPLSLHEEINNVPEKADDLRIPPFLPPEILSEASGPVERYHFAPPFESVAKSGTSPSIMSLAPTPWAVSISALKFAAVSPGVPFRWCQRSSTTGYPDLGRTRNTA